MTAMENIPHTLLAALFISGLLAATQGVSYVPDTGADDQCEYKFTVKTPVDCSVSDPGLKEDVLLMKQNIDMTRISQVSSNSAVQEQIATLKDGLNLLDAEVKEIKASQNAAALTPDVARDDELNKVKDVITELEGRLSTVVDNVENQVMYMQKYMAILNNTITSEKVERFRIESNLQAQVNQMLATFTNVKERLTSMEKAISDFEDA